MEFHSNFCQYIHPHKPNVIILSMHASLFTVAHEIAHAYLKHHTDLENLDHEKEANNQAKKWGFIRNRTAL